MRSQKLTIESIAADLYMVRLFDENGKVIFTQKLLKE